MIAALPALPAPIPPDPTTPPTTTPPTTTPPTTTPDRPWLIETLWKAELASGSLLRGGTLPADLQARFAGRLEFPLRPDGPTIIANFVSTIDGAVALDRRGATGGREISGGSEPDRFLMGLLRASADAVLVGAGTVRASRSKVWTPRAAHPASAVAFADWRRTLGLPAAGPATVVVSGSGSLDPAVLGRADGPPVLIVTTTDGVRRLRRGARPDQVEIIAVPDGPTVAVETLTGIVRERGFRLVLSEAGPTLFGRLLGARAVDELFLTVAPQIAGRSDETGRLALVEGTAFPPALAPRARLRSVMRSTDHLFLRYDLRPAQRGT
jgi:riboflavin biosynthesis pyrimidine reductase